MPKIRYRFSDPNSGFTADFTITTEASTRNYTFSGSTRTGYAITSVSGTVNGQSVTLKPSNNMTTNPLTNDPAANGNVGQYDNVYWLNDSQGNAGYSNFGVDNRGIALTTGSVDYKFINEYGVEQFQYTTNNSTYTDLNSTVTQFDAQNNESPAPCYVTGTRILTARGAVAVEDLAVGDLAVTASGAARPVRWIGHRTLPCRGRADLLPVRIAAGAFGEGRPARDLLVSPGHALCVDLAGDGTCDMASEGLVPAIRLVNGTTIAQVETARVTYWHVELDSHDILLAEGMPAESYLDMGNRGFFAQGPVVDLGAGPEAPAVRTAADFCRPFHEAGPSVERLRERLEARARALGWRLVEAPLADLHLLADGQAIHPEADGLRLRFALPAAARDVRLVSTTSVPAHVRPGTSDDRRLGVPLAALVLDDGVTGARSVAPDDARLGPGFHTVDGAGDVRWRWTDGAAVLPSALWEGCRGTIRVDVTLAAPALPRWVGPGEPAGLDAVRRCA